jgi:hypothetical protein
MRAEEESVDTSSGNPVGEALRGAWLRVHATAASLGELLADGARAAAAARTRDVLTSFIHLVSETVIMPLRELDMLDVFASWKLTNHLFTLFPPHPRHGLPLSPDEAFSLHRRAREAAASYGPVHSFLLSSSWSSARSNADRSLLREQEKLIERHKDSLPSSQYLEAALALDTSESGDEVLTTGGGDGDLPFYFVAFKRSSSEILIGIRGTVGLSDLVRDLAHHPTSFRDGTEAHSGVLQAAQRIAGNKQVRSSVLQCLDECSSGCCIVIVGHSLGAGVATLLGWLFKQEGGHTAIGRAANECDDSLRVYAFAPPATVSPSLAEQMSSFVESIVLGDDIVPRLSFASIRNARNAVRALAVDTSLRQKAEEALKQHDWQWLSTLLLRLRSGFDNSDALHAGGLMTHITDSGDCVDARRVDRWYVSDFVMKDNLMLDHLPAGYCSALLQASRQRNSIEQDTEDEDVRGSSDIKCVEHDSKHDSIEVERRLDNVVEAL